MLCFLAYRVALAEPMPRVLSLQTPIARRELLERLERFNSPLATQALSQLRWQAALFDGLRHVPYFVLPDDSSDVAFRGALPLSHVASPWFGSYLVGLPYVNSGGVIANDHDLIAQFIDAAANLADQLKVRYLELRHEVELSHARLTRTNANKVIMRLALPGSSEVLWQQFTPKVRNQIRKGEKSDLSVHWGRDESLDQFYRVFSHNMRDLGTPCFGKRLFRAILASFGEQAEICTVRQGDTTVAAALLVHDGAKTEVPSASSLRAFNHTNANMLMYWHLLQRAVERQASTFDFGRSTVDSGTFQFKKQWGAEPFPSYWQYYVRKGDVNERRPDNPRYQRAIAIWRKLPVPLTRIIGPPIVRGIP